MLHFYDFEVFKYDWLVVIINPIIDEKTVIVNDVEKLKEFYESHKNDIWVGFNSRNYDQYILKGILCGFDPYKISKWIIEDDKKGWQFSSLLNKIPLYNYDVYKGLNDYGLKTLEAFMGNDIEETSVPFDIDRKLTANEISETIKYCTHDVEQTIEVFLRRKDEFDTHINMIKEFKLPFANITKTTPQLLSLILKAERTYLDDEFDVKLPDVIQINKYKKVPEFYLNCYKQVADECNNDPMLIKKEFYKKELIIDVAGVEHNFKWGGVHGAKSRYKYECKSDELLIMADVTSLYPSIDIIYELQSRAISDKTIFPHIYNQNIEMKKNKDPRRPLYKLACNMNYGAKGDKNNALYDKRNQNLTCVYGQVLLLDLIEKLEKIPSFKLIQSNTDGILIKIKRNDFEKFDDIVYEWETRTQLNMEFTYAKKIIQKDVNNYVMVTTDGKAKTKGAYVKKLNELDYDLPIINKALVDYLVNDISVEQTINECNDLHLFQKIVKLTKKYNFVKHNNQVFTNKSYRVFASKDVNDTKIFKCKGEKEDKFANTPDKCFIDNGYVKGKAIPNKLDKQWYIDLTKERLRQFGVL